MRCLPLGTVGQLTIKSRRPAIQTQKPRFYPLTEACLSMATGYQDYRYLSHAGSGSKNISAPLPIAADYRLQSKSGILIRSVLFM